MATITTKASTAVFRPSCAAKSRFLTGSSGKLHRELAIKSMASPSSTSSFKVAAKKGEWLPGLASLGYLDGSHLAMLGVVGMLLLEVFTKNSIINAQKWHDAGKAEYFASSSTLFVIEFILFHYVEIRRWQDIKNSGSVNQDPIFKQYNLPPNEVEYPEGIFNPLNFAPTPKAKEKELANGRLAMLAFLGFVVQYNITGKGPFDNLLQHLCNICSFLLLYL
ncbi:hypothetical protein I3843_12G012300 [Carya illinoinensis]|uniref:Chlorophyll a-b binding protein, chloroplastic n=1 Tax=Carya illinoinensis TaxID=32201 RepID=A0A8T1NW33_CARIL|nr:hypothetical protein I3760_12G011300 [Carya illinoinensis]KAG6632930.1 hypothetical protein CIPAW_12G012600 [Carya illinoinensis]KAG6683416.1 hypothetical protein I3842_12G011300 [Carya illinoinensis]KAG7951545.1 hypothetical protein I3843_12G012300 [Carya illinoinensis]